VPHYAEAWCCAASGASPCDTGDGPSAVCRWVPCSGCPSGVCCWMPRGGPSGVCCPLVDAPQGCAAGCPVVAPQGCVALQWMPLRGELLDAPWWPLRGVLPFSVRPSGACCWGRRWGCPAASWAGAWRCGPRCWPWRPRRLLRKGLLVSWLEAAWRLEDRAARVLELVVEALMREELVATPVAPPAAVGECEWRMGAQRLRKEVRTRGREKLLPGRGSCSLGCDACFGRLLWASLIRRQLCGRKLGRQRSRFRDGDHLAVARWCFWAFGCSQAGRWG
jgi:hypothetical protein